MYSQEKFLLIQYFQKANFVLASSGRIMAQRAKAKMMAKETNVTTGLNDNSAHCKLLLLGFILIHVLRSSTPP